MSIDAKTLETLRQQLLLWRDELVATADKAIESGEIRPTETHRDFIDMAADQADRERKIRLRYRERNLVGKIDEALRKIEEGGYGICEECGCDITVRRLEARPVASLCIECKREQELNEA